jgi:hypothetical protein
MRNPQRTCQLNCSSAAAGEILLLNCQIKQQSVIQYQGDYQATKKLLKKSYQQNYD